MKACNRCGGLLTTEEFEYIAGTMCNCPPAAPVGDDAELIERLKNWSWIAEYANDGWGMPAACTRALRGISKQAADRLESLLAENSAQAARIAELERERHELLRETTVTAYRKLDVIYADALRQLAAAQACVVAVDAMRARTARVPEHWAAYDAARAALNVG